MAMIEQPITPEDEARYFQVMNDYNDLMRRLDIGPVPMCHFTPMEFHECDSDPSGRSDGYQCRHCGHSEDSTEVRVREAKSPSPTIPQTMPALDSAPF